MGHLLMSQKSCPQVRIVCLCERDKVAVAGFAMNEVVNCRCLLPKKYKRNIENTQYYVTLEMYGNSLY